jgi:hypothetical protein
MRHVWVFIALMFGVLLAPKEVPGAIIFTTIADTSTPIPSSSENFTAFSNVNSLGNLPGIPPAVSGTNVAFIGTSASNHSGVYLAKNGALTRIADRTTSVPGAAGSFVTFNDVTIDGSNVAFKGSTGSGSGSGSVVGIYKNVGSGLARVSDRTAGGFSGPDIVGSAVYVYSEDSLPSSSFGRIVTDAGGTLHTLVSQGIPTPGGTGVLGNINCNIAAADGGVAFFGSSAGQRGIYLYRDTGTVKIADRETLVPQGTGKFVDFNNGSIGFDGTDVAFAASDAAGIAGIYRTRGGALVNVATSNTIVDGYGKIGFFDSDQIDLSLDGGRIAFSNHRAIFTEYNGSIQEIIGVGNSLQGKTIDAISFGNMGFSGDQLGFEAHFTDGSSGIFLATVPLPSALPVGLPVGAWIIYRARFKSRR